MPTTIWDFLLKRPNFVRYIMLGIIVIWFLNHGAPYMTVWYEFGKQIGIFLNIIMEWEKVEAKLNKR